jgi:hypothetical protein
MTQFDAIEQLGRKLESYAKPLFDADLDAYIEDTRMELLRLKVFATRNLMQSFVPMVETKGRSRVVMKLYMADYWKYVHYGVNGVERRTTPIYWKRLGIRSKGRWSDFLEKLRVWKMFKGIPRHVSEHALAESIKRKGIVGRPFLDNPTRNALERLDKSISGFVRNLIIDLPWR